MMTTEAATFDWKVEKNFFIGYNVQMYKGSH
jgi:hypothetical protein